VLALAEAPTFDPNRFARSRSADRAHAFLDAQEPGTTLKAFLVAAPLEKGAIRADQFFDCEDGTLKVPGKTIRDLHPHGALRPADIVRVSSNIGAVKIAWALGRDHFGCCAASASGAPSGFRRVGGDAARGVALARRRPCHGRFRPGSFRDADPARGRHRRARNGGMRSSRVWSPRAARAGALATGAGQPCGRVISRETARSVLGMLEGVVARKEPEDAPRSGRAVAGRRAPLKAGREPRPVRDRPLHGLVHRRGPRTLPAW
jgi:cell division protein FtsI (penicillin-binding protein 3)